ncbi:MAG: hybrid sensor histidine kinase/response regulator [Prochloraceae cyanobacterium]|nr:hybrid sensor histidine kinase/response regulator [Prochloraceae cyanobacterium]
MDKEQQCRIDFIDEAEDYFDRIESTLLGLASTVADPQQLDLALRAAHSVKGGAAMMGFDLLSQVAHRLEDFFKILRVRYHSSQISIDVETLLLEGVDSLRQVCELHRQGLQVEKAWLDERVTPLFDRLRQHLGDLQTEDENALLAQDEDVDPALLVFEDGVEAVLDRFEGQLGKQNSSELREELAMTANELAAFGQMANLAPFIQLCQSVGQFAASAEPKQIESLAHRALKQWRRSHALVLRGRVDKLQSQLDGVDLPNDLTAELEITPSVKSPVPEWDSDRFSTPDAMTTLDLSDLQAELANLDSMAAEQFDGFPELTIDSQDLAELQAAFAVEGPAKIANTQQMSLETNSISSLKPNVDEVPTNDPVLLQKSNRLSNTVRVPVAQLQQLNDLLGKLILERNKIDLRFEQLKKFGRLMKLRIDRLEQSNTELRQWYDRASLESILPLANQSILASSVSAENSSISNPLTRSTKTNDRFDALEMDRYTDLHLISQEQIETIVQLQEVSADIELGLREINYAFRDFNQTTKALQSNVTRTQMLPFADLVKHFPRAVRDLSVQFDKQVNLKIEGKATLIDRAFVDILKDPLMHLLRNAFGHGIEIPAQRVVAGKSPEGTIIIKALNRGTQTVITISDDGGGIDLDKIRTRLLAMGIPNPEINQMSEAEILDCIFEPGFSTAERITELSGRGVGMDVVRNNLKNIRGNIKVQTQPDFGTTFTLSVPFASSILRVMLLERAGIIFAISVDSVREILHLQPEQLSSVELEEELTWNRQKIPVVRLEESLKFYRPKRSFEMPNNSVIDRPTILIVGEGTRFAGIHLDRFWGEQEVTIRPIESPLTLPDGFISSIILGDGRVIPLLDPLPLVEMCLDVKNKSKVVLTREKLPPLASQEQGNTILIVDDSINVRRYLALTLEKAGYQVEQAKDGQEAIDKLFGGLHVDAVICDIEMPRLDGYGVLEEVKAKKQFYDLPIVMLTSRSNQKHRKLAINLGASDYFSKPYNEHQLLSRLKQLVRGETNQ